jgi:oxygen-independent coproporphyrinogen III oxidase
LIWINKRRGRRVYERAAEEMPAAWIFPILPRCATRPPFFSGRRPSPMDAALVDRFGDQRIPRYTSYPTAPHFSAEVGARQCQAWLGALDPGAALSLYLHVPFCSALCWYCGCHTKVPGHDAPIARYVEALEREIRCVADLLPGSMRVVHLHWGGGTPTIIGPARFHRVMELIRRRFAIADEAELAIEIDPRQLAPEMAAALREQGITRASLGVQSFDPVVQQAIHRVQSFAVTERAVDLLRGAGIAGINFDILYGLPHQTVSSCRETVERAASLAPDRLAVFGYAHVPAMKRHQQRIDAAALPGAAERHREAEAIADALLQAGYTAIGLDHFARPEDELARALAAGRLRRNFQGYTADPAQALIGFGASAISALPQGYLQNTPLIGAYDEAAAEGRLATARGVALDEDDRLRRDIIDHLMCYLACDLGEIAARHGADATRFAAERSALQELAGQGIIRLAGDRIEILEECRLLVRVVAAVFDAYLDRSADRHARAI